MTLAAKFTLEKQQLRLNARSSNAAGARTGAVSVGLDSLGSLGRPDASNEKAEEYNDWSLVILGVGRSRLLGREWVLFSRRRRGDWFIDCFSP